jgi:hypothetical protein
LIGVVGILDGGKRRMICEAGDLSCEMGDLFGKIVKIYCEIVKINS